MVPKLNLKKFCKNFMEIDLKKIEKLPTDVQREFLETFENILKRKKKLKYILILWPL
jgi:hypothetical protein